MLRSRSEAILRPSTNETTSSSWLTSTAIARALASTTEELIPCLQEGLPLFGHQALQVLSSAAENPPDAARATGLSQNFATLDSCCTGHGAVRCPRCCRRRSGTVRSWRCARSERRGIAEAAHDARRILVDAYRAGHRIRHRHSKLDVGKARGKDPEVPVDGRAIEDLDRQLDIARREEPDVARVVCCRDDLTEANLIGAVLPLH